MASAQRFVFGLVLPNQSIAHLKLLKVVDLTSYTASTSAPAVATGARGKSVLQIAENPDKTCHRVNAN
jgi:hypothetical protein